MRTETIENNEAEEFIRNTLGIDVIVVIKDKSLKGVILAKGRKSVHIESDWGGSCLKIFRPLKDDPDFYLEGELEFGDKQSEKLRFGPYFTKDDAEKYLVAIGAKYGITLKVTEDHSQ